MPRRLAALGAGWRSPPARRTALAPPYDPEAGLLTEIAADAATLVVDFGCEGSVLVDVLLGERTPRGRLPFDLPSSMAAVEASRPDVPFDTEAPLFRFGDGLDI